MAHRKDKLESLIQESLSSIFLLKLKDPAFSLVTVTKVRLSPDLKIAKIYISVFDKTKREVVVEKLDEIKGFIRSELAQRVKIRFVPEVHFYIDDTLDYVEKMENLFRKIHKEEENK
jgi:ribosome-binding factor A